MVVYQQILIIDAVSESFSRLRLFRAASSQGVHEESFGGPTNKSTWSVEMLLEPQMWPVWSHTQGSSGSYHTAVAMFPP